MVHALCHDGHEELIYDVAECDRAIVFGFFLVSTLEEQTYGGITPTVRYDSSEKRVVEGVERSVWHMKESVSRILNTSPGS